MGFDLSSFSNEELDAIKSGDLSGLSNEKLDLLAKSIQGAKTPQQTTPQNATVDNQVGGGLLSDVADSFKRFGSNVAEAAYLGTAGLADAASGLTGLAGKALPYMVPGLGLTPTFKSAMEKGQSVLDNVAATERQIGQGYATPESANWYENLPKRITQAGAQLPFEMAKIGAGGAAGLGLPLAFAASSGLTTYGQTKDPKAALIDAAKAGVSGKILQDAAMFSKPVQAGVNFAAGAANTAGTNQNPIEGGLINAGMGLAGPSDKSYGINQVMYNLPEAFSRGRAPSINPQAELYGQQMLEGAQALNPMGPNVPAPIVEPSRLLPAAATTKPILIPPKGEMVNPVSAGKEGSILGPSLSGGANPQLREVMPSRPVQLKAAEQPTKWYGPNTFKIGDKVVIADELTPQQRVAMTVRNKTKPATKWGINGIKEGIKSELSAPEQILKNGDEVTRRIWDTVAKQREMHNDIEAQLKMAVADPSLKVHKTYDEVANHLMGKPTRQLTADEQAAYNAGRNMLDNMARPLLEKHVEGFKAIDRDYFPNMPKPEFRKWIQEHKAEWIDHVKKSNPEMSDMELGDLYQQILNSKSTREFGNITMSRKGLIPDNMLRKDALVLHDYAEMVAQQASEEATMGKDFSNITAEYPNLANSGVNYINDIIKGYKEESTRAGWKWRLQQGVTKTLAIMKFSPVSGYIGNTLSTVQYLAEPGVRKADFVGAIGDLLFRNSKVTQQGKEANLIDPYGNLPKSISKETNVGKSGSWWLQNVSGFRTEPGIYKVGIGLSNRVIPRVYENWKQVTDPNLKRMYRDTLEYYGLDADKVHKQGGLTAADKRVAARNMVDRVQNFYNDVFSLPKFAAGNPWKRLAFSGTNSATRSSQLIYKAVIKDLFKYRNTAALGTAITAVVVGQMTGMLKGAAIDALSGGPDKPRGTAKSIIRNQALGSFGGQYADVINRGMSGQPAALLGAFGLPVGAAVDATDTALKLANPDTSNRARTFGSFVLHNTPGIQPIAKPLTNAIFPKKTSRAGNRGSARRRSR